MKLSKRAAANRRKANARKRDAWIVIRITAALRDRIREVAASNQTASGQVEPMHKTIGRALATLEDPKGAARIRALERELVGERAQLERVRKMHAYASSALAKLRRETGSDLPTGSLRTDAAERTLPMFVRPEDAIAQIGVVREAFINVFGVEPPAKVRR